MKKIKKGISLLLAAAMLIGMVMMPQPATAAKVKVKSVKVASPYSKKAYVAKGKSIKISKKVTVTPNKSKYKKVSYRIKNKKIASVNGAGVVKGKKAGTTKLILTSKKNKKKKATISICVMKKAVTKVKLSQKTATLRPGQVVKLTKTIQPTAGASKKVKWHSSNTKVAKVSSQGQVTAVSTGTAVIKATALDGSKKNAKCTVTVKDSTDLTNVDALDETTIRITLNKAQNLSSNDITLQVKKTAKGNYQTNYSVSTLSTSNQLVYEVRVGMGEYLTDHEYLKVTVPSLSGTKSQEIQMNFDKSTAGPSEQVITTSVNEEIATKISFGGYLTGYANYQAEGLPAGFSIKVKNGELYLCGSSRVVLDNQVATITATDEAGRTTKKSVRLLVGSSAQIVFYVCPQITLFTNERGSRYKTIYAAGGSGSYQYKIAAKEGTTLPAGIKVSQKYDGIYVENAINTNDEVVSLAEGNYPSTVSVTDEKNAQLSSTREVGIKVINGVTISGVLTDAAGAPIANANLYAGCMSNNEVDGRTSDVYSDAYGRYSIRVCPNETYYLVDTVEYSGVSTYRQVVGTTPLTLNLSSPYYKVVLNMGTNNVYDTTFNADKLHNTLTNYSIDWIDDTALEPQMYCSRDKIMYLPAGTYHMVNAYTDLTMYGAGDTPLGEYRARLDMTITQEGQTVEAVMTNQKRATMIENNPVNIVLEARDYGYVEFEAKKAGTYRFTSMATDKSVYYNLERYSSDYATSIVNGIDQEVTLKEGETTKLYLYNSNTGLVAINGIQISLIE